MNPEARGSHLTTARKFTVLEPDASPALKIAHLMGIPSLPESIDPYRSAVKSSKESPTRNRYIALLGSAEPELQPFLRTQRFIDFIDNIDNSPFGPGPTTNHILETAETGDMTTFLFGVAHAPQMTQMDEVFFRLQTPPAILPKGITPENYETTIQEAARALFSEISQEVWKTVADTTNQSSWRSFLLSHFKPVFYGALNARDQEGYIQHAKTEYERIKRLAEQTPTDKWRSLATYLNHSGAYDQGIGVAKEFDDEVASGTVSRFYAYQKLRDRIVSERDTEDKHPGKYPKNKARAQTFWLEQFKSGAITFSVLEKMQGILEQFEQGAAAMTSRYKAHHPAFGDIEYLRQHTALIEHSEAIQQLLAEGIIPTAPLIELLAEDATAGLSRIVTLQQAILDGKFNPNDPAHRALELPKFYDTITSPEPSESYTRRFADIPFIKERAELAPLTERERMEAQAATYEAAMVYRLIEAAAASGRDVIVVGNRRYGTDLVTLPLEGFLKKLGVQYIEDHIGSTLSDMNTVLDIFPDSVIQQFSNDNPHVIIVDGTQRPLSYSNDKKLPRFPAAFQAYLNWFLAYNNASALSNPIFSEHVLRLATARDFSSLVNKLRQASGKEPYSICQWSPMTTPATKNVIIGEGEYELSHPDFTSGHQVVLANSVSNTIDHPLLPREFSSHTPGYFDDPEDTIKRMESLAFTPFGLTTQTTRKSNNAFIEQVQTIMRESMQRMIEIAPPYPTT